MTRRALVVANDRYDDPGLRRLRSPGQDADALSGVLGDPAIGGFVVTVVRNAEVQQLREHLDRFFSTADRTDELLVHFSCHGLKDDANDLYLAAVDTRTSILPSTGLPADFVARRMRASRARSIALFLDCCYGGAFERGMLARAGSDVPVLDSFGQDRLEEGAGRVVITASSAVEYAFEGGDLTEPGQAQPSVFTSAVVEGIATGEADSDGTGTISVRELFAYAERQVRKVNRHQTPQLWAFGTHGDIMVARSPLRRVVPAALPVSVQTALAGDRISRLGAVQVLSELLDGDPPTALAAVQALQFLVNDDSRSLSEAARNTLHRVRLTATPEVIEVPAGAAVPAEVVLGGSPVAITARVESKPDWVQTRQIGDHLYLTVDTPTPAEGSVQVSGPTGAVDIRVIAAAVPEPAPQPVPVSRRESKRKPRQASEAPSEAPESSVPPTHEDAPAAANGRPSAADQPQEEDRETPRATPRADASGPPAREAFRASVLWVSAAVLQVLVLFLPPSATGRSSTDFVLSLIILLVVGGLLATGGFLAQRPGPSAFVVGGIGVVSSTIIAVGATVSWISDGGGLSNFVAMLAAATAVAALVVTIRDRRAGRR